MPLAFGWQSLSRTISMVADMETPVEIDFQGVDPDERVRSVIATHVQQLEERFGRITAGRVVLKGPGGRHRTGGLFDGVIDFEKAAADPNDPLQITPALQPGDHLHPNDAGYAVLAAAIAPSLFEGKR